MEPNVNPKCKMCSNLVTFKFCDRVKGQFLLGYFFALSQVKKILKPLPTDKDGRIKIDDFLNKDIHSEDAFKVSKK